MVKEESDKKEESQAWNIASAYTYEMIFKPLREADYQLTLAMFGASDLAQELELNDDQKNNVRKGSLRRGTFEIIKIIDNSLFNIKIKADKEILLEYKKELNRVINIIHLLFKYVSNQVTKTRFLKLREEKYYEVLGKVREIKSSILIPLNRSGFIFKYFEEIDEDEFKKQMEERFGKG